MIDARKNLIILIFVLAGTLISLGFLNFHKIDKNQSAQILLGQYNSPVNLPVKLSKGEVDYFTVNNRGRVVFYEKLDSMVYETNLDGKNKKLLTKIPNASDIIFSPDGQKLIALVSGKKYLFDLLNNQKVELNKKINMTSFSPSSEKIAFYTPNENSISISNPDGSDSLTILKTRISNLRLLWPEPDLIIFYPEQEISSFSLAFSITPDGKDFKKITQEEINSYTEKNRDHSLFINPNDGKLYFLRLE